MSIHLSIKEAEKSPNLYLVGIVSVQVQRLESCFSKFQDNSESKGRKRLMAKLEDRKKVNFPLLIFFFCCCYI